MVQMVPNRAKHIPATASLIYKIPCLISLIPITADPYTNKLVLAHMGQTIQEWTIKNLKGYGLLRLSSTNFTRSIPEFFFPYKTQT